MSLSPEREGRLTASTFASAMGINKYQTRQKLYRQILKIDPRFDGNEMTQWGEDNEQNCCDGYELNQSVIVYHSGKNQKFRKHPNHDWLGCTPDGFTDDRLVEFKCPYNKMYDTAPAHYVAQIMGQMAITGMAQADLVAWTPEELRIWRIDFSQEYWDMQLGLLQDFWQCVKDKEEPKRRKKPTMPSVEIEFLL